MSRDFVQENEASRLELRELIEGLREPDLERDAGAGWTVSTLLCHLAFWDLRILYLVKEWQRSGMEPTVRPGPQAVDSINEAVKTISRAVPGRLAAQMALESAAAVDSELELLSGEWIDRISSAGLERALRRSLHRREHLRKIKEAARAFPGPDRRSD